MIHKKITVPPLRPIISMSGTVTHDVAEYLNTLIRPFIDSRHLVKPNDEFLLCIKNTILSDKKLVSLDVTSLFTKQKGTKLSCNTYFTYRISLLTRTFSLLPQTYISFRLPPYLYHFVYSFLFMKKR